MKKYVLLIASIFCITTSIYSQSSQYVYSNVDKVYSREDMGLHINWLFPGECLFYWAAVLKTDVAPNVPVHLDSIEVAIAFERFNTGFENDTLLIDIFKPDLSGNTLERYYSYKVDIGNEGFPPKFSSDPYSSHTDTRPTMLKIKFKDYGKYVQFQSQYIIIGIRAQRTYMKSPWYDSRTGRSYELPNSGLHIGKLEFDTYKDFKEYSRRYVIYNQGNSTFSSYGKLEPAFPNLDWCIYMRGWASPSLIDPLSAITTTEIPNYRCEVITGINDKISDEKDFELSQNYPNPFNPGTMIKYALKQRCRVKIDILNILGQHIINLLDTYQDVGSYSIPFDASQLNAGYYYYRLSTFIGDKLNFTETKKMLYLK